MAGQKAKPFSAYLPPGPSPDDIRERCGAQALHGPVPQGREFGFYYRYGETPLEGSRHGKDVI